MKNLEKHIQDIISPCFSELKLFPILGKHGNLTFLAQPKNEKTFLVLKEKIKTIDGAISDLVNNSPCHRFFVNEHKVAIIYTSEEDFDFTYAINSYHFNMIMGGVFKQMGLILRNSGLFYEEKLKIETHQSVVGDFKIMNNQKQLFDLLGLDFDLFCSGFNTLNQLFDFYSSSPYFPHEYFLSKKNRRGIQVYEDLREYLKGKEVKSNNSLTMEDVANHFSNINVLKEIENLQMKEFEKREFLEKFNGQVVIKSIPDIDKSKLGEYMKKFKFSFGGYDEFKNFVINHDIETIMSKFKEIAL